MRWVYRLLCIALLGLVVTCFVYPFLHEVGHYVTAYICGAEDVRMGWHPIPHVILRNGGLDELRQAIIGMAGYVFPLLLIQALPIRYFWCWLFSLYIRGITLVGCLNVILSLLLHTYCGIGQEEDIVQIVALTQGKVWLWILGVTLFLGCLVWSLHKDKPLIRILQYL